MPNWGKDFTEGLKAGRAVRKSWDEGRKEDEERAWRIKDAEQKAHKMWKSENDIRKSKKEELLPPIPAYKEPEGWDKVKDILGLGPVRPVPPASATGATKGWPANLYDLIQSEQATDEFGGEADTALTAGAPRSPRAFIHAGSLPQVAGEAPGAGRMYLTGGGMGSAASGVTADKMFQYLTQAKGLSPAHALGMVANIRGESNFNPTAVHDGGTGYGLFGHRLERRDGLFAHAKTQQPDWRQQVDYALTEPEGQRYLQQDFGNDYLSATQSFLQDFERPKDVPGQLAARTRFANQYAGLIPTAAPQAPLQAPPIAARPNIPMPPVIRRT